MSGPIGTMPVGLAVERLGDGDRDDVLEFFQLADDQGAVRPRTGQRDVEVIAAALGQKSAAAARAGTAVSGDVIVVLGGRADEMTVLGARGVFLPPAVDEQAYFVSPLIRPM